MAKDLDKPKESSEKIAERKWRNNALAKKAKEGKTPIPMMVYPEDIDYVSFKVKVDKTPPGTVIENDKKPRAFYGFERKFLKEVRSILDERKQEHLELIIASIRHERRKLMLEKIRRLELDIARNQAILAQRQKNADEGQMDLFASLYKSKDLFA